jgi:hypothetical protein
VIYCVEQESRDIYEARALGNSIMIRPAESGAEHFIERLNMLDFNRRFDVFYAQFLIPNQLKEVDYEDAIY